MTSRKQHLGLLPDVIWVKIFEWLRVDEICVKRRINHCFFKSSDLSLNLLKKIGKIECDVVLNVLSVISKQCRNMEGIEHVRCRKAFFTKKGYDVC